MDRLEAVKVLRERFNLQIEGERHEFIRQLHPLVRNWINAVPNHRDIFREEEIDSLLNTMYTGKDNVLNNLRKRALVGFFVRTGYRDEPTVGEDGKPLLRRTTAVHGASRRIIGAIYNVRELFQIYNRFDANYVDEDGVTHFHIACQYGCDDVVEKFLDLGRINPNACPVPKTGNSPLHLAQLEHESRFGVVALLLSRGADPNSTNLEGRTPLHFVIQNCTDDSLGLFIRIVDAFNLSLHIDARDKLGQTPLHLAMQYGRQKKVESLLRRGANPNLATPRGFTPLHVACVGSCDRIGLMKLFFVVNDELNQSVEVDAPDKLGRTPLHYAVANLFPHIIDELLDRGADLSGFAFPTEKDIDQFIEFGSELNHQIKYNLVSRAMAVVDVLEKKGRELCRSEALIVMKFFAKRGLFEKLEHLEPNWYENEEFASRAKEMTLKADLSLYDLMRLRPREAEKLCSYTDYLEFGRTMLEFSLGWYRLPAGSREACSMHLCDKMSRRFFRSWALESFLELIHYRLPILCCDMIIDELQNQDLYNICLAAFGQSS